MEPEGEAPDVPATPDAAGQAVISTEAPTDDALHMSSLPDEYFTPLDSFDAVHHMLECLPDDLSETFLGTQVEQTQIILDSVNAQLSARVMRSYGAFVHGMAQVQQLKSELVLTAMLARSARKHLGRVQDEMVEPGLTVVAKLRRQRTLSQLLALSKGLSKFSQDVHALLEQVTACYEAQQNGERAMAARLAEEQRAERGTALLQGPAALATLSSCAELLARCEGALGKLGKLKQARQLQPAIGQASERLQAMMHCELRASSSAFDEEAYSHAVRCALELQRMDELVNQVQNNFAEAIKNSTKQALHAHVVLSLGDSVGEAKLAQLDAAKYKDVCAQLHEEYFDSCLAHSFKALIGVLRSHHLMLHSLMRIVAEAEAEAEAAKAAAAAAAETLREAQLALGGVGASAEEEAPASPGVSKLLLLAKGGALGATTGADGGECGGAAEAAAAAAAAAAERNAEERSAMRRAAKLEQLLSTLHQSRATIWDLMQRRVAVFLGSAPISTLTVEQFLEVLVGVSSLMRLGESFADADSHGLRSALRSKARSFYGHFQRERLDELRMRLETELWQSLPLEAGWSLDAIKELRPRRGGPKEGAPRALLQCRALFDMAEVPLPSAAPPGSGAAGSRGGDNGAGAGFHGRYDEAAAFFEGWSRAQGQGRLVLSRSALSKHQEEAEAAAAAAAAAEGAAAGAAAAGAEEATAPGDGASVLLCSTALNMARFTGRYLAMMLEMEALAADVLKGYLGLLELYLLTVFSVFWTGPPPGCAGFDEHDPGMPQRLRQLLLKLRARTHATATEPVPGELPPDMMGRQVEMSGHTGPRLDLARTAAAISLERLRAPLECQPMFALSQTVVAMESLQQLSRVLEGRLPSISAAVGDAAPELIEQLRETLEQVPAMAHQIYRGVARGMLDLEPIVSAIRNRSWVLRELDTQHNAYIDQLVAHVQQLISSLQELGVPEHVKRVLMHEAVTMICEQLVDGYCYTKKCSDEGRALISLDVTTLHAALRTLLPDQPLPMDFVDNYLKAFYLPPEQILGWAKAHPEYAVRHLSGLVAVSGLGVTLKKKEQQELLASLEEQARR